MKSVKGKILLGMVATIVIGMLVIGIVSIVMSLQSSNSILMQGINESFSYDESLHQLESILQ